MKKIKTVKISVYMFIAIVFIFFVIIGKLLYVATFSNIEGTELTKFVNNRNTKKETIVAPRGTIYSSSGEVLAKDVNSYTVVAFLSESRTTNPANPYHVVDKDMTAEALSPIINMDKEAILKLLNLDVYQVELGPGGRGITELVKEQIEKLDLPGIGFLSNTKRYYPNGNFASYTIGYAKANEEGVFNGEMGVEKYFNEELSGENGYIEYQQDRQGYQITSLPSVLIEATAGNDVYLTIDTNVQMFVEQAMKTLEESEPEWATITIMDAKTGAILGTSASPSFDNNKLDIKNYYDPLVAYTYEPGSTLKIFSFMAAMENGIYNGEETYKSGRITVDDYSIKDWNDKGWGNISYNEGFYVSSNVAAINLGLKLGRAKLKDFYSSVGFGKTTGITLPNEQNGVVNFRYNTEVAAASYGHAMTITAIQLLEGLTVLSNNGIMLKPYIVSKVVDNKTGKILKEYGREELGQKVSIETVETMKNLMRGVVTGEESSIATGIKYYQKGYDLIGKTGTAQIASSSGGYLSGSRNYVRNFAGMFPGENPEVIVYVAASKMTDSNYLPKVVKSLVKDLYTYLNIDNANEITENDSFNTTSYINKNIEKTITSLEKYDMDLIVLGDGEKVLKQYPPNGSVLNYGDKIFLLTSLENIKMPNIKGWSRRDVETLGNMIGMKISFEGYGYVKEFNIKPKSLINDQNILEVKLEPKYKEIKNEE